MVNKNAILLSLAVILLPVLAQAQELVIFDARDLFPKEAWNPPCKAVFTQEYYDSEEWMGLKDRLDKYLLYRSAQENPDWIPLADEDFRQMIEEGKSIKPEALQKAICRHAVGGRMFVGAELMYRNRLAAVREKPFTEAEVFDGVTPPANAWGVMNAKGEMILPFEYQGFASSWDGPKGDWFRFIVAQRQIGGTASNGKYEVFLFLPSGKKATDIKLEYAEIYMGNGPDEHRLIIRIPGEGFTLMDEECNILTPKRYDEFKKAKFYASDVEGYWGKRGGKYYLVDVLTGREQGSFTFSKRDKENIFFDVKITWF